jgi:hypothetical protein
MNTGENRPTRKTGSEKQSLDLLSVFKETSKFFNYLSLSQSSISISETNCACREKTVFATTHCHF